VLGNVGNFSTGGGAINLTVAGTLTLDGTVGADGNGGVFPGAGGGAGGSVLLTVGSLAGGGNIAANGGAGQDGAGGGGGGGRIAIYAPTNQFTGLVTAGGGPGFAPGQNGTICVSTNAAAGSVPMLSPLAVLGITQSQETDLIILTWLGGGNGTFYQVQSSVDLINWQPYGGLVGGAAGPQSVTLPAGTEPQRYFRIVVAN
jgi:hypothetical protein